MNELEKLHDAAKAAYQAAYLDAVKSAYAAYKEAEAKLEEQVEWVKSLADDLIAAEGREARLKEKLEKAVEVLIVYENKLVSLATATDDYADEAEIFLDRDRGRLARNVLAEIEGETE